MDKNIKFGPILGISHGHTGHVRFLTCVELTPETRHHGRHSFSHSHRYSLRGKDSLPSSQGGERRLLVISGGDGYEDFRGSTMSDGAGRDDSTNHLLIWRV